MRFIIGVGNPESKYDGTRHNIGFAALDAIGGKTVRWKNEPGLKALTAEIGAADLLVKPKLYVNNTGGTVSAITARHDCAAKDLLVICDDVNLAFGKLRLRPSGSAGGHHGLESVIQELGSEDFARLRIGVGNERMPKDLAGFVLEKFDSKERDQLEAILNKVVSISTAWLEDGFDRALNELSKLASL